MDTGERMDRGEAMKALAEERRRAKATERRAMASAADLLRY